MNRAKALLFLLLVATPACGQDSPNCSIPGDKIHWITDFCMAKFGTDDEIPAMDCIDQELRRLFPDDCSAKRHYKRAMCEGVVSRQAFAGTIDDCLADENFMGPTVRNGGVGN